jgi:hypothetical protein
MANLTDLHQTPENEPINPVETEEERVQHAADQAAQRAAKTEQKYDRDHDLFTK